MLKKFIIAVSVVIVLIFAWNVAYYRLGIYIDLHPNAPVTTFMTTDEDTIYMQRDGEMVPFEIRGVNMGVGIPGEWATDYAIDGETYQRWFAQIQELGPIPCGYTLFFMTISTMPFTNIISSGSWQGRNLCG